MAKKQLPKKVRNTYEDYRRKFYTAREELKRKGQLMYDDQVLSETEWTALNKSFENKLKREVAQGKRESIGDINKIMVKQQTYEYSRAQAQTFRKELLRAGHSLVSVEQIMLGQFNENKLGSFYEQIGEEYEMLKAAGASGAEAQLMISHKYFGS